MQESNRLSGVIEETEQVDDTGYRVSCYRHVELEDDTSGVNLVGAPVSVPPVKSRIPDWMPLVFRPCFSIVARVIVGLLIKDSSLKVVMYLCLLRCVTQFRAAQSVLANPVLLYHCPLEAS